VNKRFNEFIFVRCGDKKTAQEVGAKRPPEVIFFNPDGEEYYRTGFRDASSLLRAMDEANKKYGPKEVSWTPYDDSAIANANGRVVLLAFANDSKESESTLKALEDRICVKFHEKVLFLKTEYRKDSDEAKKWGVSAAPAIVLIDPSKESGSKSVIDRQIGKRNAGQLRSALTKAVRIVEKPGR